MKKVGYPSKVAAAVEVAASTNGQLMPPIMGAAAFIIAEYVGIPYLGVVKAAIIPAAVVYAALFYITHLEAKRLNIKRMQKEDISKFSKVMKEGWHHLIGITTLIVELAVFQHTPQLAVFRSILVLLAVELIRSLIANIHKKKYKKAIKKFLLTLSQSMVAGSRNMLPVAMATAMAGIIVGVINMGIGSLIVQFVEFISLGNVFLLLFTTAVMSLVIGMGLPTTATYVVMASITVPIILELGGNLGLIIPAIAAHLFCFYFGIIADSTPPVGIAAYAAAAIAKTKPVPVGVQGFIYGLRTTIIPFAFVLNPAFILWEVNTFWGGILVFLIALLGTFAFTNAVQGWMLIKNTWYETVLFFVVAAGFLFAIPVSNLLRSLFGGAALSGNNEYLVYFLALVVYIATTVIQRIRAAKHTINADL